MSRDSTRRGFLGAGVAAGIGVAMAARADARKHRGTSRTFVGPTQDHLLALAKDLGIGLFDTYDSGDNVYVSGEDAASGGENG